MSVTANTKLQWENLAALTRLWTSLLPVTCPTEYQFNLWLHMHGFRGVCRGIQETAEKALKMKALNNQMSFDHAIRFASSTMNRTTRERYEAAQNAESVSRNR